jgi:diguanylate cyclase (GGDEF)-like protein
MRSLWPAWRTGIEAARKDSVRSEPGLTAPINPAPQLPPNSAAVVSLIEDLAPFYDDGNAGLQRLVSRIPLLLEVDRAYIARLSPDGVRFTVTQSSKGDWPDLLGYTQSAARLPAFARGALKTGIQATVDDALTFPFTPQQRKMLWYGGLRGTVLTPIRSNGVWIGALVIDVLRAQRVWDFLVLEASRTLAGAIGARLGLAKLGDHLVTEERDPVYDMQRLNVLSNIAQLLESSNDPSDTSVQIVDALSALNWVRSARLAPADDEDEVVKQAQAGEGLVVRNVDGLTHVALALTNEGERFGAIDIELVEARLSDVEEQFLRSVQTFAGSAYMSALRRARPRNETLYDSLTGLLNYRSINEVLVDAVHASKSSGRPVSVWLLDLDRLEGINRDHGYAIGDDVVSYVGHTLQTVISTRGSVGRVGGGLFLAVFPGMEHEEAAVQGRMMVERVTKNVPPHLPAIGISVGVAAYPSDATGHDDVIRFARLALYMSKSSPNRVVTADPKNPRWVSDARASFLRAATEQQMPAALQERR